jgi:hypothetical protein
VQYELDLLDIISIQNLARQKIAMRERLRRDRSVAKLQGAFRCAVARRALGAKFEERETRQKLNIATITCQVSPFAGFVFDFQRSNPHFASLVTSVPFEVGLRDAIYSIGGLRTYPRG